MTARMKQRLIIWATIWGLGILGFFIALGAIHKAHAQDITNHAIPVGGGPGVVGWKEFGPCTATQTVGWPSGVTGDPACSSTNPAFINIVCTSPPPLTTTNPTTYFNTYDQKGCSRLYFTNSENQTAFAAGSFRDGFYVSHFVTDTTSYGVVQHVAYGIRAFTNGPFAAGVYSGTNQDLVGLDATAIGQVDTAIRGVSGITASCIQLGVGICSNEFAAIQPTGSAAQSLSMSGLQAIISSKQAASDLTHRASGVMVTNIGKSVSAAYDVTSAGTSGDNGQFEYLLRGENATVNAAAILMPASSTGNLGTRILYDLSGGASYTEYDRGTDTFNWAINGSGILSLNSSAWFSSTIVNQFANGSAATPTYSWINSVNAGMFRAANNEIGFSTASTEAMRIDASQRLIIGNTAAVGTQFAGNAFTPPFQIQGTGGSTASSLLARYSADASGALIACAKSRNATKGSHTIVQNGDTLCSLTFAGSDGTNMIEAARISSNIAQTPGTNDMPGSLLFWTTPDGSNTPIQRLVIDPKGHMAFSGTAPTLTAGCNGAGSSVSGNDTHGTVTGSTAASTTCTLTFSAAYGATPDCVVSGLSSPLTGAVTPSTGTLVVNYTSTANYKWSYHCYGL